jgi:hypothetical protein
MSTTATTSNIAKSRKRERFFRFLRFRKPSSSTKKNTSQTENSRGPPTGTSTAVSSGTSVLTSVHTSSPQQSTTEPLSEAQSIADVERWPTSQSGPARAGLDNGTVSTTTSSTAPESLWAKAVSELDIQESETLADFIKSDLQDMASILGNIRNETLRIVDAKRESAWKINVKDEEIVLKDIGMKILMWVDQYKGFGDIVVQVDPVHAALPWAMFSFLLQVGGSTEPVTERQTDTLIGLYE